GGGRGWVRGGSGRGALVDGRLAARIPVEGVVGMQPCTRRVLATQRTASNGGFSGGLRGARAHSGRPDGAARGVRTGRGRVPSAGGLIAGEERPLRLVDVVHELPVGDAGVRMQTVRFLLPA